MADSTTGTVVVLGGLFVLDCIAAGADFTDMLIRKRVDLVLHGHEHFYQRSHQLGLRTGCATVAPGSYDADCVADRDGAMSQGAGTVFATSGLGGQEKRNVDPADAEAP